MSTHENESKKVSLSEEGRQRVDRLDRAAGGGRAYLDDDYTIQAGVTLRAESSVQVVSEGGKLWLFVWPPGEDTPSMKLLL